MAYIISLIIGALAGMFLMCLVSSNRFNKYEKLYNQLKETEKELVNIQSERDYWEREAKKWCSQLGERKLIHIDGNIKEIADYYGYEPQSRQLIEEMAELTVAINKYWRACKGFTEKLPLEALNDLAGEVADVTIMLEQIRYLLLGSYDVKAIITEKILRQLERISRDEPKKEKVNDVTTNMMEYLCDNLCRHPIVAMDQEQLEVVCAECKMGQYVCDILNYAEGGQ